VHEAKPSQRRNDQFASMISLLSKDPLIMFIQKHASRSAPLARSYESFISVGGKGSPSVSLEPVNLLFTAYTAITVWR